MTFQTSRLAEVRAQSRHNAVAAARAKAELYAQAAGMRLGRVLHIEDVDPNVLRGGEGHNTRLAPPEEEGTPQTFDPAAIVVTAAVLLSFELAPTDP